MQGVRPGWRPLDGRGRLRGMTNPSEPTASPTEPAGLDQEVALQDEREALRSSTGTADDERDVLIDGKQPGESSEQ